MCYSHHSHSGQFCSHAKDDLESIVLEAIRQKFKVYCLTEHCPRYRPEDLYPEEVAAGLTSEKLLSQFQQFLTLATNLKEKYKSQINLLVGLESEYINETTLAKLDNLIGQEPHASQIDLVVGSVHHVNEIPIDFDHETFLKAVASTLTHSEKDQTTEQEAQVLLFMEHYFDAQHQVMLRLHPEIIGHFDLCRLYTPSLNFHSYPSVWEKIKRNIAYAISYGALFEINSAAFRKGWETAYPGKDVLQLMLQMNARLTLSDDSHGVHMVGLNYSKVQEYLVQMGVTELWYLSTAPDRNIGGRYTQPVRDPAWGSAEFWSSKHPQS